MFEGLSKLEQVAENYKIQMEKEGKQAVVEGAKDLFAKYPGLAAITWVQYAPHFNDGDACEFSVHECEFVFDDESVTEDTAGFYEGYQADGAVQVSSSNETEMGKDLNAFDDAIHTIEDALEMAFGDGVQVTIARDGSVDVDSYSHD